jgi:hypothetical protein
MRLIATSSEAQQLLTLHVSVLVLQSQYVAAARPNCQKISPPGIQGCCWSLLVSGAKCQKCTCRSAESTRPGMDLIFLTVLSCEHNTQMYRRI